MSPIDPASISALILCGGRGSRLSNADKPLIAVDGVTLVERIVARLRPQVGQIIVSANAQIDAYTTLGYPVVADKRPGLGPLGGLDSALPHIASEWIFVCPGDAPLVPLDIVDRLAKALAGSDRDIAIPHDGTRSQHLFMLLRTTRAASASSYLATQSRSVIGWVEQQTPVLVDCSDIADQFINVNTPEDLSALLRTLAH